MDLGELRVVHACWDDFAFAIIDEALARHGSCTDEFLVEGWARGSALFDALEIVLKGKEIELPEGAFFTDKDGHIRHAARVRWFDSLDGHTVATYTLPRFSDLLGRPPMALSESVREAARPYPPDAPPVFFGHYWLDDASPMPLAPNVVCLDYSVAKGGFLCGYRWQGGGTSHGLDLVETIDERRFVALDFRRS